MHIVTKLGLFIYFCSNTKCYNKEHMVKYTLIFKLWCHSVEDVLVIIRSKVVILNTAGT